MPQSHFIIPNQFEELEIMTTPKTDQVSTIDDLEFSLNFISQLKLEHFQLKDMLFIVNHNYFKSFPINLRWNINNDALETAIHVWFNLCTPFEGFIFKTLKNMSTQYDYCSQLQYSMEIPTSFDKSSRCDIIKLYNSYFYDSSVEYRDAIENYLMQKFGCNTTNATLVIVLTRNYYRLMNGKTFEILSQDKIRRELKYFYSIKIDDETYHRMNHVTMCCILRIFGKSLSRVIIDFTAVDLAEPQGYSCLKQHISYLKSEVIPKHCNSAITVEIRPYEFHENEFQILPLLTIDLSRYCTTLDILNVYSAFYYIFEEYLFENAFIFWNVNRKSCLQNITIRIVTEGLHVTGDNSFEIFFHTLQQFRDFKNIFKCFGARIRDVGIVCETMLESTIFGDYNAKFICFATFELIELYCKRIQHVRIAVDSSTDEKDHFLQHFNYLAQINYTQFGREYFSPVAMLDLHSNELLNHLTVNFHAITVLDLTNTHHNINEFCFVQVFKLPWLTSLTMYVNQRGIFNWDFLLYAKRSEQYILPRLRNLSLLNNTQNHNYEQLENLFNSLGNILSAPLELESLSFHSLHLRAQLFPKLLASPPKKVKFNNCIIDEDVNIYKESCFSKTNKMFFLNMTIPYLFLKIDRKGWHAFEEFYYSNEVPIKVKAYTDNPPPCYTNYYDVLYKEIYITNCLNMTNAILDIILSHNKYIYIYLKDCSAISDDFFYEIFERKLEKAKEIKLVDMLLQIKKIDGISNCTPTIINFINFQPNPTAGECFRPKIIKQLSSDGTFITIRIIMNADDINTALEDNSTEENVFDGDFY